MPRSGGSQIRRVAAVAPLVLQNDPERRVRGLPPLIDTAGDDYDFGGFAVKRGHGQEWAVGSGQWAVKSAEDRVQRRSTAPSLLPTAHCPMPTAHYVVGARLPAPRSIDARHCSRRAGSRNTSARISRTWICRFGFGGWAARLCTIRRWWCGIACPVVTRAHAVTPHSGAAVVQRGTRVLRNVRGRQLVKCLPRHAVVLTGKALRRWQEGMLLPC